MDALCQAIESWWSVNSTPESKAYSKKAIELIMPHWQEYILNNKYLEQIMLAANYAGRAINLAQTTAAHAMSYKITSLYNLPHGHAVALCLPAIWDYMIGAAAIADPRGPQYLCETFSQIASAMAFGGTQEPATTAAAKPETPSAETTAIAAATSAAQDPATPAAAIRQFRAILDQLGLSHPDINPTKEEIETLASSVNPIRLKNNPIYLSPKTCKELYLKILQ